MLARHPIIWIACVSLFHGFAFARFRLGLEFRHGFVDVAAHELHVIHDRRQLHRSPLYLYDYYYYYITIILRLRYMAMLYIVDSEAMVRVALGEHRHRKLWGLHL